MMVMAAAMLGCFVSQPALAQASTPEQLAQQVDHPDVTTRHKGVFNGTRINYTAAVESTIVKNAEGKDAARIVSYAYLRDGVRDKAKRPVVFLFNGGPIAPSIWVHLGGLGPKRVAFPDDVKADPSTFKLVDNSYSPLDMADLVFVDPASTGYSRVLPGVKPDSYFSVRADAQQFAAFIRNWMQAHGRSESPIYLFGESYGTNRAAEIAGQLAEDKAGRPASGVFLYGQALNIIEYSQRPANVNSYVASLPTIAATGYFHGKADRKGRTIDAYLADARAFARDDYLPALFKGSDLPAAERQRIAARLEEFSGISADWYLDNNLKITKEQYRIELLKPQGLLLGRSDARYVAPVDYKGGAPDPAGILASTVETFFRRYLRDELKVTWPESYLATSPVTGGLNQWVWGEGTSPFADWPYYTRITRAMEAEPTFRLVIGNGYYDTMTTMGAAEMLATQSGWSPDRVKLRYYDGGHMGYSVDATAKALGADIRAMVQ